MSPIRQKFEDYCTELKHVFQNMDAKREVNQTVHGGYGVSRSSLK
jgi:hypothetical protein